MHEIGGAFPFLLWSLSHADTLVQENDPEEAVRDWTGQVRNRLNELLEQCRLGKEALEEVADSLQDDIDHEERLQLWNWQQQLQ